MIRLLSYIRFSCMMGLLLLLSQVVADAQNPKPAPTKPPARPPGPAAQAAPAKPGTPPGQTVPAGQPIAPAGQPGALPPPQAQEGENEGLDKRIPGVIAARGQDLSTVLSMLQVQSGVKMVLGQGINQKVTFNLENQTLREVLNYVLPANGLGFIEKPGGVVYIDKAEVIDSMRQVEVELITRTFTPTFIDVNQLQSALESLKSQFGSIIIDQDSRKIIVYDTPEVIEKMDELISKLDVETETRIFQIKYANAQEIADQLTGVINTTEGELFVDARNNILIITDTPERLDRAQAIIEQLDVETMMKVIPLAFALPEDVLPLIEGMLTENGYVDYDQRTGRLIIEDIPSVIERAMKLIKMLDIPDQLVYIEADIITVSNSKDLNFGTTAAFGGDIGAGDNPAAPVLGSSTSFFSFNPFLSTGPTGLTLLDVRKGSFRLQIDAMVEKKQAEIIASPRLLVKDGEVGSFNLGSQEPYSVRQQGYYGGYGGGYGGDYFTQQFRNVGTSMEIEVYASEAGYVEMYISVEDTKGRRVQMANVGEGLAVDGSFINTAVTVKSGRTVVLGGIINRSTDKSHSGVPVVSSIPIFGSLFRKKITSDSKQKMLVFITPTIVNVDDPYEFSQVDNIQKVRDLQSSGATGFLKTDVDKKLLDWRNEEASETAAIDEALEKQGKSSDKKVNGTNGKAVKSQKKNAVPVKKQLEEGIIRTNSNKSE